MRPGRRACVPTDSIRRPLPARVPVGCRRRSGSHPAEDGKNDHPGQDTTGDDRMHPGLASHLKRKHDLTGGCTSCGASCNLLFKCPHWTEGSRRCSIYEDVRWRAACFRSRLPTFGTGISRRAARSVGAPLSGKCRCRTDRGKPNAPDRRAAGGDIADQMYYGEKFNFRNPPRRGDAGARRRHPARRVGGWAAIPGRS